MLSSGLTVGGAIGLGTMAGLGARLNRARAAETLTIETGTGEYADCLRSAFYEPFEKATGIKILTAPENHNASKFKLEVETHHYIADVQGIDDSSFAQPPNGPKYFEPIDYSVVNREDLIPDLAQTYAVATDTYAYTLGYNSQKTGGKIPRGWADFFDLQTFPGKRGVGDGPTRMLIMALLADGVAPDAIVPLDFDRAFKQLDTIKSQLVYWETGSQVQDLLVSGETPLTITFANRVASSLASGKAVGQVWNGYMIGSDMLGIPKGSPNKVAAMKYISFVLSRENNGRQTDCIALGPSNIYAKVNPKWAEAYPTSHLSEPHVLLDSPQVTSWLASHIDEVNSRFQLWKSA
jgi:putative spermidine/putrescine transport system substrate-binding protein